jgi:hypothetical protein
MDSASFNPPPIRQEQQHPGGSGDGTAATCILNTTQLRWQLVRAVEAFQNGEFENVELRKEVMMLRAEVERAKSEKPKVDYSKVAAGLLKRVEPMKAEMKSIREQLCANAVSYNSDYFVKMNTLIKKLTLQNTSILAENKILLAENFELKSRADIDGSEMQQVAIELKAKNSEIAKLKKEVEKLKLGSQEVEKLKLRLQEYESNKSSSQQETGDLKRKIEELTLSLYDIVPKYDFSKSEVIRLTQQIAGFEMDSQSSYEAHISQQQNIISYYEKLVGELKCENSDLNLVVHSQQEQIEKLTNSLLGNKSHFAKFVELKSENIQLQSKLTQITKKVNNGAILGTGSLLGSNQNSLYSINNSVSSLSLLQSQVPKSHAAHPQGGIQHQMQPIAVPADAISPKKSVILALPTIKGDNLPSARESGRERDREPLMISSSSNINDNTSMDDEIEKDHGEDTIKSRILKRREKKNQSSSSNQNQNVDINRHYNNQNLQEPEPEFVGEIGMNSFADSDYDDNNNVNHSLNFYKDASHQTNSSTTTKYSSSHNMPTFGGGKMINLSLIDDSNSVCDQLAKVEAFARMSPKKLLPKGDLKTNSNNNNNNNNGGYAPESTLSMSARSVISPRVPSALRPNNAYGSNTSTSTTSSSSSSSHYYQQQQSGGGSNVLKNGIAAGQIGHFTNGGGGGSGIMSMSGASMGGGFVGNGDVKKITI